MTEFLTSKTKEVGGSKETDTEAKRILLMLVEDRQNVSVDEIMFLKNWFMETEHYSEDAVKVIEDALQEKDYFIFDEELYYRQLMEAPTSLV